MSKEKSDIEKAEAWEKWVRSEINSALDIFLPISYRGDVNLEYIPKVLEHTEAGPVLSDSKKDGVKFTIVLKFEESIDKSDIGDE